MTKNRFLSKRLACLLTTALITTSLTSYGHANVVVVANGLTTTAADATGNTGGVVTTADILTFTGATGTIDTATTLMTIAGINSTTADSAVALTGAGGLTVTGNIGATADMKDLVLTVAEASSLRVAGNIVLTTGEVNSIILAGSTLTLNGTDQTIAGIINSDAGNDGILALTGAGTKTFSGIIGGAGTNELGSVTVASGTTAVFSSTLDSVAITNSGTLQLDGGSNANTITNSGTLIVNNTLDNIAANGDTAITMNATGSVLTFNATDDFTQNIVITAATNGFGTINVLDSADGAPAVTTVAGAGIGTTAARIGQINIGSATKAGALTTSTTTDDIFANAVNIQGGNIAEEDSILTLTASDLTATNGITLTKGLGDATLATVATSLITGTIDGAGTGAGSSRISVTTGGTATFANNIGSTTAVDSIVVNTATADFKGNVTATTMSVANALGFATFSGTTAQTFTGNITATNGQGTLTGSNAAGLTVTGTVGAENARLLEVIASDGSANTFQGAINAITFDIDSNAAAEFVSVTAGNIIGTDGGNTGALQIETGAVLRLDPGVVAGTTVFNVTEATATTDGVVIAGDITIRPSAQFNTGTVVLIDGDAANTVIDTELADILITNNALTSYAVVAGAVATEDVNITATAKSDATTASELGVNTNKAAALRAASTATGTAFATDRAAAIALDNAVNAFSGLSETADTEFANQVSPQTDTITGSTIAAKAVTSGVQNVISTRLASLRSGDAYSTGVVTGSHMGANSGFIQAFGSQVDQKNKGNEFGYDADTTGFAIGFDTKVPGGAVIGISYAHSEADVDGKGTGRAKNDIKTDSVSLYADYATKDGYVEGSITYGKSDNKGSRIVNTAGLNRTYNSNYDSEQYSFRLSGGIPQSLGGGAFITPFAAATISQIKADAYTETSTTANDALRLRVSQDTVDSQVGSVGVKFHQAIKDGKTTFTPEVKLAINQEFGDGNITTTNTYQGGGASFKNSTAIEKTSATAGLGLNISSDNVSFNIGYEADVKDKYLGHSAQAKLTAKF